MKLFVSTCDTHDHMIKPFMYLFNKFWGEEKEVTILGYRTPPFELYNNFKFISLAKEQKNANQWAEDHNNFFSTLKDSHFIWTVEDSFLLRPVDFNILNKLNEMTMNDKKIGRAGYTPVIDFANKKANRKECKVIEENDRFNIIQKKQNTTNRISVVWSIWQKDYCLKYLKPGWSPWDTEILGSKLALNDGYEIISTEGCHAIDYASAHRKGSRGLPDDMMDFRYTNKPNLILDNKSIQEMFDLNIINKKLQVIK